MRTSLAISMAVHGGIVVAGLVFSSRAPRAEDRSFALSVQPPLPPPEAAVLEPPTVAPAPESEPEEPEVWEEAEEELVDCEEFLEEAREEVLLEVAARRPIPAVRLPRPLGERPAKPAPPPPLQAVAAPRPRRVARPAPKPAATPSRNGVFSPAQPLPGHCPPAKYPRRSRRMGHQGEVILLLLVRKDGTVGEVEVESSSGHPELDRAAIAAVRRWRFDPARRDGRPVHHRLRVPFRFRLG